jgi:hypothetical protein
MKKLIVTLLAAASLAGVANATIAVNEPFSYTDGSLITVSSGLWFTHSGSTPGQVDVASGKVNVVGTETEDVSTAVTNVTGVPFTTGNLYASFVVNFSVLPAGSGAYFAHFRTTNTTAYNGKIFANTTGAAAGKFRLGVLNNSGTATNITTDLTLGTDYKVVLRYNVATAQSTLWLNPSSESATLNRADDFTATTAISVFFFALRQATSEGTMTIDDLKIGDQFTDVQTVSGVPSISGLVDVSIPANSNTGPMPFLVSDAVTPATSLVVTATSGNTTLVPNSPANLTLAGTDTNRTLTVTPAAGEQGTANIDVVVTDGNGEMATNSFTLTVGSPSISAIANQVAPVSTVKSVSFVVNDAETAPGSLTVTAISSDQTVLPDANIGVINSGNTNRTLQLTNAAAGSAVVTVTVSDGTFNIPTTFTLTAYPDNGILLAEDFSYADGSIITNSAFLWNPNTGTTGQTQVASGQLLLQNISGEDIYRWFTNASAPIATNSGQLIYTRFVANFSALPTASGVGQYFQHIYAFSGAYRARLFATTNGAAAGKFRFSLSNGGFITTAFPQDLSTGESHVIITRYNTATGESILWVDPASEASASVSPTDATTLATAYGISFRQDAGVGAMNIDDLLVGSTFNQVFLSLAPSPESLTYTVSGTDLILSWTQPAFVLNSATDVTGPYTPVSGATSPYTNSLAGPQTFFRLIYP